MLPRFAVPCCDAHQALLSENEGVRERIRFLEGIVQDITKERDDFKAMMRQLTTSQARHKMGGVVVGGGGGVSLFLSIDVGSCAKFVGGLHSPWSYVFPADVFWDRVYWRDP